jgi:hypothetical protein
MAKSATSTRFDVQIILGVSTALYAASLATVTGLQSVQDQAAREGNAGLAASLSEARGAREAVELDLRLAGAAYNRHIDGYEDVRARADLLAAEVAELAALVESVNGAAARLPAGGAIATSIAPRVVRIAAPAPAPATHATTGASG